MMISKLNSGTPVSNVQKHAANTSKATVMQGLDRDVFTKSVNFGANELKPTAQEPAIDLLTAQKTLKRLQAASKELGNFITALSSLPNSPEKNRLIQETIGTAMMFTDRGTQNAAEMFATLHKNILENDTEKFDGKNIKAQIIDNALRYHNPVVTGAAAAAIKNVEDQTSITILLENALRQRFKTDFTASHAIENLSLALPEYLEELTGEAIKRVDIQEGLTLMHFKQLREILHNR